MDHALSKFCIYTIVHRDRLDQGAKSRKPATFPERKAWVTGSKLWQQASINGQGMPVLFADAAYGGPLLYWGLLTDVRIGSSGTTYTVDRLREVRGKHVPQELILRSTGKKIARNYIRPYAICGTPKFLNP